MNTITIELCAEDRARLDKLQATMEQLAAKGVPATVTEAPKSEPTQEQLPEQVVIPEVVEPEKAPEPQTEAPKVSVNDVQRKVVELSQAGKKAEVRAIVKAYADKVSTIPEDKLAEVLQKLTALGG